MRGSVGLVFLCPALGNGPADAQTIVGSPAPDRVAVTVHRDPGRNPGEAPTCAGWRAMR